MDTLLAVLLIVCGLAIIICTILKEPKSQGMGALSGNDTNVFGRSASQSRENTLDKIVIAFSIALVVLCILITVR